MQTSIILDSSSIPFKHRGLHPVATNGRTFWPHFGGQDFEVARALVFQFGFSSNPPESDPKSGQVAYSRHPLERTLELVAPSDPTHDLPTCFWYMIFKMVCVWYRFRIWFLHVLTVQ